MAAAKLVGVIGSGLIGTDPFAADSWSGSSPFFFRECDRQGLLHRAFGVEVANGLRWPMMLANFSPDRDLWRQKFYLDTRYYRALSRRIAATLRPEEAQCGVLQIGGIFDLRPHLPSGRLIYSYHDGNLAQAVQSPHFARGLSQRRVRRALAYERTVAGHVDVIFTMSEYLRASFINDYGANPDKVCAIGAGINLATIPEPPVGRDYDAKKILFVGADFERKGGQELLRAFRRVRSAHPRATLSIVGPRELTIPADLSAGVNYLGFLSRNDPAERGAFERLAREASLFVMPSLYEPFGIAPLEAMAYEIPAILTDAWAFPEMVTPGENGDLVRKGDVEDLAEKIVQWLREPERLRSMGQAARARVLRQFTWPAVVAKLRSRLELA